MRPLSPSSVCTAKFPLGLGVPQDTRDTLSFLLGHKAWSRPGPFLLLVPATVAVTQCADTGAPLCTLPSVPAPPPSTERPQLSFAGLARPPG